MVSAFKKVSTLLIVVTTTFFLAITIDYDSIIKPRGEEQADLFLSARQVLLEFNRECAVETGYTFIAGEKNNLRNHLLFIGNKEAMQDVICNNSDVPGLFDDSCLKDDESGSGLTKITIEKYFEVLNKKDAIATSGSSSLKIRDWINDPKDPDTGATHWNEKYFAEELNFASLGGNISSSLTTDPIQRVLCTFLLRDFYRIGHHYYEIENNGQTNYLSFAAKIVSAFLGLAFFFIVVIEPNETGNLRVYIPTLKKYINYGKYSCILQSTFVIISSFIIVVIFTFCVGVIFQDEVSPGIQILFTSFLIFCILFGCYGYFQNTKQNRLSLTRRLKNSEPQDFLSDAVGEYILEKANLSLIIIPSFGARLSFYIFITRIDVKSWKIEDLRNFQCLITGFYPTEDDEIFYRNFHEHNTFIIDIVCDYFNSEPKAFPLLSINGLYYNYLAESAILKKSRNYEGETFTINSLSREEIREAFVDNFLSRQPPKFLFTANFQVIPAPTQYNSAQNLQSQEINKRSELEDEIEMRNVTQIQEVDLNTV